MSTTGLQYQLDYSFLGGRVHFGSSAQNVAMNTPTANAGDMLLTLVGGTLNLYRRLNASSDPFWESLGAVSGDGGGDLTTSDLTGLTYTNLGQATLSTNYYQFSASDANAIAEEVINGTAEKLLLVLSDFNRHYHTWEIPLRWRTYSYGPNFEWYKEYINNTSGAISPMNFAIEKDSASINAAIFLTMLTTATFDAGTTLTVYGVS